MKQATRARVSNELRNELSKLVEETGSLTPKILREKANSGAAPEAQKWIDAHGGYSEERALQEYQLSLCRSLIMRVKIVIPDGAGVQHRIRAFCSLAEDRNSGGGYRSTIDVLSDDDRRAQLISTALSELEALQRRYQAIAHAAELAPVFAALNQVREAA